MTDTPEQFIRDIIQADKHIVSASDDKFLIDFLVSPFVAINIPFPHGSKNYALDRVINKINEMYDETDQVIVSHPKCIEDVNVYNYIQYLVHAEGPFTIDATRKTKMADYISIPEGMDDYLNSLGAIPLCRV